MKNTWSAGCFFLHPIKWVKISLIQSHPGKFFPEYIPENLFKKTHFKMYYIHSGNFIPKIDSYFFKTFSKIRGVWKDSKKVDPEVI